MKRSIALGLATLAVVGLMMTLTVRAPVGLRNDPYRAANFRVEIDGITLASFSEASGLGSTTDVVEYKDGNDGTIRLLPGNTHCDAVTLTRGVTDNMELWNWRQEIVDGKADRKSVSIVVLNDARAEVARWNLMNAWPSKISLGSLNAGSNDVLIEELTVVCEGIVRVR